MASAASLCAFVGFLLVLQCTPKLHGHAVRLIDDSARRCECFYVSMYAGPVIYWQPVQDEPPPFAQ